MQYNSKFSDLSFVHGYNWNSPEEDVKKALEIVFCEHCDPIVDNSVCPVSHQDYHHVASALAANPHTPASVLDHISNCADCPKILEKIAGNSSTNDDTLKRLAEHEQSDVRRAVAENSQLAAGILDKLIQDISTDVRYTLAENHLLPMPLLNQLTNDENPYVAHRAEMTLKRIIGQSTGNVADSPSSWSSPSSPRRAV